MEFDPHLEPTGSEDNGTPPGSPRGSSDGEIGIPNVENLTNNQSDLQETRLAMNGFTETSATDGQNGSTGRKRPYQLSLRAPSGFSERIKDPHEEPTRKIARKDDHGVVDDPFAAALLAAKQEAERHSSKVSVVDEIPPLSGSTSNKYCMWNIDKDLAELIDIYFRSCMDDKAHTDLVKTFPKPNVPALHVPELDRWLVLLQGKQALANLRWEQDLQVSQRNYMDAAGPLCLLLCHLKSDPESVRVDEAINLILKSLRLLGHAVATVSKHRRQDIVKTSRITDITELGKHSDPMQKFLFGESKAKELNFVGNLAEKVSKAIQPSTKKPANKRKSFNSSNAASSSYSSEKATNSSQPSKGPSNYHKKNTHRDNQYFRRGPPQGKSYLGGKGPRQNSQTQAQGKSYTQSSQQR